MEVTASGQPWPPIYMSCHDRRRLGLLKNPARTLAMTSLALAPTLDLVRPRVTLRRVSGQ